MAIRKLKLFIDTGFSGASYKHEIEFDDEGMIEEEIVKYAEDELEAFLYNSIDMNYDIE